MWLRRLRRVAGAILLAVCIGWGLERLASRAGYDGPPAGFWRGMLHGALMPVALPNLLMGRDVPIYAREHTGRTYKLGYTVGVNLCGALFFGGVFWRFSRGRKL